MSVVSDTKTNISEADLLNGSQAPKNGAEEDESTDDGTEPGDESAEDEAIVARDRAAPAKAPKGRKAPVKAPAKAPKAPAKAPKGRKATAKAPAKAAAPKDAPKPRGEAAKLDEYGFRVDSIRSKAAKLYATGNGATMEEVSEKLSCAPQLNILRSLENRGYKVTVTKVINKAWPRPRNRYKLEGKAR